MKALSLLPVAVALLLLLTGCSTDSEPDAEGRKVAFSTADDVQLSGHLFGTGDVGVVLSHMRPADQTSWWPFARFLAEKGYMALAYDFRGYGESGGETQLEHLDWDALAAVELLESEGASKVFLVGASMGGTASLVAAGGREMAGVITLSAPEEFSGLDAMASITDIVAPKLFIAARNDSGGAYRGAMNALYDHSLEPKERHLMEGVGHGTQLLSGDFSLQVQGLIMDFLGRYH